MRDIEKQIKQAEKIIEKHPNIALNSSEVSMLLDEFTQNDKGEEWFISNIMSLISRSFEFGLAVGYRTAKNEN